MSSSGTDVRFALCSCPDATVAARLARALVDERLAACVTILPGARSIYRWRGTIEEADEQVCLIKTAVDRLDALRARLPALHPYEVPELVVLEVVDGLPAYLQWVRDETRVD